MSQRGLNREYIYKKTFTTIPPKLFTRSAENISLFSSKASVITSATSAVHLESSSTGLATMSFSACNQGTHPSPQYLRKFAQKAVRL